MILVIKCAYTSRSEKKLYFYHMRISGFVILIIVITSPVSGQNKARTKKTQGRDTVTMFHDIYNGTLPVKGNNINTVLQLDHKQYCDYGAFVLTQTLEGKKNQAKGEWTVLRGDATDENATVVELDAPGRVVYFLRRHDGKLQQLDTALHEMRPAKNYLLSLSNL